MATKGVFKILSVIYGLYIVNGIFMFNLVRFTDEYFKYIFVFCIIYTMMPVFWAYNVRKEAAGVHVSHYTYIIRTFWIFWLYVAVMAALIGILPSASSIETGSYFGEFQLLVILLAVVGAWYFVRYFRAFIASMQRRSIKKPRTWVF